MLSPEDICATMSYMSELGGIINLITKRYTMEIMARKKLNTDQIIEKLNKIVKLASEATASEDFVRKLGGITLYAGMADFLAIQSARLLEQVILKAQLAEGGEPSFKPHEDTYFYDEQVRTRRIVKEIEKFLPFRIPNSNDLSGDVEKINNLAKAYIKSTEKFLNYRNAIVHHIGSPQKTCDDIVKLVDKAKVAYQDMEAAHRLFFESIQPYRFGPNEINYFYGKEATTKK
jgi:hypothetical protein